eukprot:10281045-Alexandrium_andersonii.AAC.1
MGNCMHPSRPILRPSQFQLRSPHAISHRGCPLPNFFVITGSLAGRPIWRKGDGPSPKPRCVRCLQLQLPSRGWKHARCPGFQARKRTMSRLVRMRPYVLALLLFKLRPCPDSAAARKRC